MATPVLITPDGKKIELSPETYKQIQKILRARKRIMTKAQRIRHIDATYGKYAGKTSLTRALLKERKEELTREEAKIRRWHG
jgi:queuine/archaeosine tRNA-ribosyltransferase